jgi:hypothetical protein
MKARKKKVYSSQNYYYIFTLLPLPDCSPEGNYDVSLLACKMGCSPEGKYDVSLPAKNGYLVHVCWS